ncbi:hypothetical protein [Trinickia dabaoshanensis]|nr:hypothetical protein [Trinickia dabaoshanensis]
MASRQSDLFEQVMHALRGEETKRQKWWHVGGGPENVTEKIVEIKTVGPQRWIRRVHERGILTRVQLLAIILFTLWDFRDPYQDDEKIVSDWEREFRAAIDSGEFVPRDRNSLLPIANADETNWVISIDEADAFVAARGMAWTCTETATHLFNEFFGVDRSQPVADARANTEALAESNPSGAMPSASNAMPGLAEAADSTTQRIATASKGYAFVGLSTPDMAAAFDGLGGWSEEQWNKNLGDGAQWLVPARRQQGRRGRGRPSVWDPVHLAKLLAEHRGASVPSITAAFRKHSSLEPWRRQWDEYRIDINDWKSQRN